MGGGLARHPPDARAPGGHQARSPLRSPFLTPTQKEEFVKRFHREANAIAGLQSPNTIYLYDFGVASDGQFYYVMELVDGISLDTMVKSFGPQPAARVRHLLRQMPEFGEGYQPLTASGDFPDPVFGHPVELLVTDKASYKGAGEHWRRAEARHIAARVRGLVDTGAATPGEIVLLFAAGTDADAYEEELRVQGLPTYRATGRGYFGQQQVVDLLMYLRLLHNRYDDEALVTVLASPFVGVSNDGLVLVRRNAGRRPIFTGIERSLPEGLSEEDERLVRAFKQRYERLVAFSARASLERLCEQVVCEHDYDLAVLARRDGARRYANLRKLMRMARSYEELRGRDIEGFVRHIRDQESLGAAQREAVSEEEGQAPSACSRSTAPRASSSRSSSSRTPAATPAAGRRPTRSSPAPTAASASRSSIRRRARSIPSSATKVSAGRARRPSGRSGCGSTTSR